MAKTKKTKKGTRKVKKAEETKPLDEKSITETGPHVVKQIVCPNCNSAVLKVDWLSCDKCGYSWCIKCGPRTQCPKCNSRIGQSCKDKNKEQ